MAVVVAEERTFAASALVAGIAAAELAAVAGIAG